MKKINEMKRVCVCVCSRRVCQILHEMSYAIFYNRIAQISPLFFFGIKIISDKMNYKQMFTHIKCEERKQDLDRILKQNNTYKFSLALHTYIACCMLMWAFQRCVDTKNERSVVNNRRKFKKKNKAKRSNIHDGSFKYTHTLLYSIFRYRLD